MTFVDWLDGLPDYDIHGCGVLLNCLPFSPLRLVPCALLLCVSVRPPEYRTCGGIRNTTNPRLKQFDGHLLVDGI